MNASLRRTLLLVIAVAVLWGGWNSWQGWKLRQELDALKSVVRSADLNLLLSNPPEEVRSSVDLAIRGIQLTQGRDGHKSFDLTAEWATLNQESGAITVRTPRILYTMRTENDDDNGLIQATSDVGRVEDGNQKLSMSGNVRAEHRGNVLTGDLAIFLNQLNSLSFPGGAELVGPELTGSATRLTWNLSTNTLMGDHGVRMRWYPAADALTFKPTAQDFGPETQPAASAPSTQEDRQP